MAHEGPRRSPENPERLDAADGLAELAAVVLSAEDIEGSAPEVVRIVSSMLPGRPRVGLVIRWDERGAVFAATGAPEAEPLADDPAVHREPLRTTAGAVGTLYIQPVRPGALDARTRPLVALTADHLGTLLSFRIDLARRAAHAERLRSALAARSTVDQAVGIMLEWHRFGREQAWEALHRHARDRGVDLGTAATEIVRSFTGTEPGTIYFTDPDPAR